MVYLEKQLRLKYYVLKLDKVIDARKLMNILRANIDSSGEVTARFLAELLLNCEISDK